MRKKLGIFLVAIFILSIAFSGVAFATKSGPGTFSASFWDATVTYSLYQTISLYYNDTGKTSWDCTDGEVTAQVVMHYTDPSIPFSNYQTSAVNGCASGSGSGHTASATARVSIFLSPTGTLSYHSVEYHNNGWVDHIAL